MLTTEDICVLIECAAKFELSSLAYGKLKIEFSRTQDLRRNLEPRDVTQFPDGGETPQTDGTSSPKEAPSFEDPKEILEELRQAQLMTDNPLAYEQEMIDASLGSVDESGQNP